MECARLTQGGTRNRLFAAVLEADRQRFPGATDDEMAELALQKPSPKQRAVDEVVETGDVNRIPDTQVDKEQD